MYDLFLPRCFDIDKCFPLSGWTLYCIDIIRRFILHFDFSFQNATPPAVDNDTNFMCTIPYTYYIRYTDSDTILSVSHYNINISTVLYQEWMWENRGAQKLVHGGS